MPLSRKWIPILEELVKQNLSNMEIARLLGKNAHAVGDSLRIYGIRIQKKGGPKGSWNGAYKGGSFATKDGYIQVLFRHPRSQKGTGCYMPEHILVMESYLGRLLQEGEVVHHRNGNRQDNRIDNLQLFSSNAEHLKAELEGHCPVWSDQGRVKIGLEPVGNEHLPTGDYRVSVKAAQNIAAGGHNCIGFENHPLLPEQCETVMELYKMHL